MIQMFFQTIYKFITIIFAALILVILLVIQIFIYYNNDLPDYQQLAEYDPPTITRLYSNDGSVVAEYASERRIYIKYSDIPKIVIDAFLAAEDKNFFEHQGVDFYSIARATIQNIFNIITHKRAVGGSTITQQVVKDFLLTNERTLTRKIKEAILAYRISKAYSKNRILELYLNQIFLGNYSYGVASAAQNYFNKELYELDIAEAAMLAALPKAPSALNPFLHYERAKIRRDWVIERMAEEKMISNREAITAAKQEIKLSHKPKMQIFGENFYTESVKQELINLFGEDAVYKKGLIVNINLDPKLQQLADMSFKQGLIEYDRKHGWRGPLSHVTLEENWQDQLSKITSKLNIIDYQTAIVLKVSDGAAEIGLTNNKKGTIPLEKIKWARQNLPAQQLGPQVKIASDVLKVGDIIAVSKYSNKNTNTYSLEQIPDVNGGMVIMEPKTGKLLAMVGGYNLGTSYFNRAIQAQRQPGSAFKPIIYLAAMEENFSPNSLILDKSIELSQGAGLPTWKPKNYTNDFLGNITLRTALEKSRNTPTVRLVLALGLNKILDVATRLSIYNDTKQLTYSVALGAFETTLLNLTNAYNIIASGGLDSKPRLLESVYDRRGNLLYSDQEITCANCMISNTSSNTINYIEKLPQARYNNNRVIDKASNYQIISMLEGVVKNGTSAKAKQIGKTIAGKTGTSNNSFDTWYIGFTPYITVGIYVGFDTPRTLGSRETGATVALPIFINFMQQALKDIPDAKFQIPDNIEFRSVDKNTGHIIHDPASVNQKNIITEVFKKDSDFSSGEINGITNDLSNIPNYDFTDILAEEDLSKNENNN